MANPTYLAKAFAADGAKNDIPETTVTAGKASLSQGFPTETELPLAQGGVPPKRKDFNGILNILSSYAMFQQAGGKFAYDARVDYTPPAIIYHGSDLWWCVQENGASSLVVTPGTNTSYWIKLKDYLSNPLAAYPVGSYYMSSNSTSPAVLFGGTWTQIQNRFIFAAGSGYSVNSTGGSETKTLSVANLPAHSHSCGSAGSHTHTRGSMNITGTFRSTDMGDREYASGAFSDATSPNHKDPARGDGGTDTVVTFNAQNSWSGETSSNGSHQHSIGNTGSGTAFNSMPPYIVAYVWRRTA